MIYLDNAASSYPKPPSVIKAVSECLANSTMEHRRSASGQIDVLSSLRKAISELVEAHPDNVILCPGATYALNVVIQGKLRVSHPGRVLATSCDHTSVLRPLRHSAPDFPLTVIPMSQNEQGKWFFDIQLLLNELDDSVRLVVMPLISNVMGVIFPVEQVASLLSDRGIPFVIDASQGIGNKNLSFKLLQGDVTVCFAGHKNLYGPPATGGFICSSFPDFPPIIQGGTGVNSESLLQPTKLPHMYEVGTPNFPGFAGLLAGVEWVKQQGVSTLGNKNHVNISDIVDRLSSIPNVILYLPDNSFKAGILNFNIRNISPMTVGEMLQEGFEIITRDGLQCAPLIHYNMGAEEGSVRISVSAFNTSKGIDNFIHAIKSICK